MGLYGPAPGRTVIRSTPDDLLIDGAEHRRTVWMYGFHPHDVSKLHEVCFGLTQINQLDTAAFGDARGADLPVVLEPITVPATRSRE
jgi:hypothetical protein